MKSKRHLKILEIVRKHSVETQEALAELLIEEGYDVTQATISRDIKQLRLTKSATSDGRYVYAVSDIEDYENSTGKALGILRDTVKQLDSAQNLIVVKTYSGMAQAAAAALDSLEYKEIVGSIAGDDTVMLILRDNRTASEFLEKLIKMTSR
ncbi:MAG: arginine repressor [Clostridia bacterium]|nr:arginine repressor [Clostridia bacterium]